MLVLSRKSGESICIGDSVKLQIVRVSGGRVLIGIDAPKSLEISRPDAQDGGDAWVEDAVDEGVGEGARTMALGAVSETIPAAPAKVPLVRFKKSRMPGF